MQAVECEVNILVAGGLTDCLNAFLQSARNLEAPTAHGCNKELKGTSMPLAEHKVSLSDPVALIDRCLIFLSDASVIRNSGDADNLVHYSFSVLLEASMISTACWTALKQTELIPWILKRLLLEDERQDNRQAIAKTLKNFVQYSAEYVI